MKKILLPTDFSDAAKNAFRFAQELAGIMECGLEVVHVYHPTADPSQFYTTVATPDNVKLKNEQLDNFVSQNLIPLDAKLAIKAELVLGFAGEELVRISKEEIDLIVMGRTGASGILEKAFGSISSQVSGKAHCPVLLIPKGHSYKGIDTIAYASNYQAANDALFEAIIDFANYFKAAVHLVHVDNEKEEGEVVLEDLMMDHLFKEKAPGMDYKLVNIKDDSVWEGLDNYMNQVKADLLVMVSRKRSFWESLMQKSITKELLHHANYPVLVLHS